MQLFNLSLKYFWRKKLSAKTGLNKNLYSCLFSLMPIELFIVCVFFYPGTNTGKTFSNSLLNSNIFISSIAILLRKVIVYIFLLYISPRIWTLLFLYVCVTATEVLLEGVYWYSYFFLWCCLYVCGFDLFPCRSVLLPSFFFLAFIKYPTLIFYSLHMHIPFFFAVAWHVNIYSTWSCIVL